MDASWRDLNILLNSHSGLILTICGIFSFMTMLFTVVTCIMTCKCRPCWIPKRRGGLAQIHPMNSSDLLCSQSILMRVDDIHLQSHTNHNLNANSNVMASGVPVPAANQPLFVLVPYDAQNAYRQQKETHERTALDTIYPIIERL